MAATATNALVWIEFLELTTGLGGLAVTKLRSGVAESTDAAPANCALGAATLSLLNVVSGVISSILGGATLAGSD